MNSVQVNGITYSGNGNIVIKNDKVYIGGKDVTPDSKEINITITDCKIEKLEVDHANTITIEGAVDTVKTMSGDVKIFGEVTGSVSTMSGDVSCGSVGGKVSTMSGDIRNK